LAVRVAAASEPDRALPSSSATAAHPINPPATIVRDKTNPKFLARLSMNTSDPDSLPLPLLTSEQIQRLKMMDAPASPTHYPVLATG
jgi:hypothetical protein